LSHLFILLVLNVSDILIKRNLFPIIFAFLLLMDRTIVLVARSRHL